MIVESQDLFQASKHPHFSQESILLNNSISVLMSAKHWCLSPRSLLIRLIPKDFIQHPNRVPEKPESLAEQSFSFWGFFVGDLMNLILYSCTCIAEGNQTLSSLLSLKSNAAAEDIKTKAKNELGIHTWGHRLKIDEGKYYQPLCQTRKECIKMNSRQPVE